MILLKFFRIQLHIIIYKDFINIKGVEGWRYQNHYSCLMYSPPQLKIILPFDLQKMSGQGVQTHFPMSLLVLLFNILIFLWGLSPQECLPSLTVCESFIVSGALSLGMMGRLFGCHNSAWRLVESSLPWRDGLSSSLSFHFAGDA